MLTIIWIILWTNNIICLYEPSFLFFIQQLQFTLCQNMNFILKAISLNSSIRNNWSNLCWKTNLSCLCTTSFSFFAKTKPIKTKRYEQKTLNSSTFILIYFCEFRQTIWLIVPQNSLKVETVKTNQIFAFWGKKMLLQKSSHKLLTLFCLCRFCLCRTTFFVGLFSLRIFPPKSKTVPVEFCSVLTKKVVKFPRWGGGNVALKKRVFFFFGNTKKKKGK